MGLLSKYGSPSVRGRPSQGHRNQRGQGRMIVFPDFVISDFVNQLGQIMATTLILAPSPFRIFRPSYGLATNLYVFSCNINDNIIMIKDGSSRSVYERAKHSNQWSQILFEAAYNGISRDIWLKTKSFFQYWNCQKKSSEKFVRKIKNSSLKFKFVTSKNNIKDPLKSKEVHVRFLRTGVSCTNYRTWTSLLKSAYFA